MKDKEPDILYDNMDQLINRLLDMAGDLGAGYNSDNLDYYVWNGMELKIWLKDLPEYLTYERRPLS